MTTKKDSGTASGTVITWPSFITTPSAGPRQSGQTNFFTVPPESYGDGWITGMAAAIEYLDHLRLHQKGSGSGGTFLSVIEGAVAAMHTEGGRGAGIGFLRMLEDMVCFASMHANYSEHIGANITRLRAFEERDRARRKEKGRAFYERMQAAKQAKRRQSGPTTEACHGR